jgi:DNA-directed RNA polymerase specialized sigma24 family protein
MGVSMYDAQSKERRFDSMYTLDTGEGVSAFLEDVYLIENEAENGDYTAIDILTDLQTAIHLAELTDREIALIDLYYTQGYTYEEIGGLIDSHRTTIARQIKEACQKIAEVYVYWALHGEGYNYTGGTEDGII